MALPRITIVTPSLNQRAFLEEAIESVLSQDYPNLEYIVIDGGSTDGSKEIIEKYGNRLAYWQSRPDAGHAAALNEGFSRSTGEILCWLNADDRYLPWTLETVAEIFSTFPDIAWIQGHPNFWDERGRLFSSAVSPTASLSSFLAFPYAHPLQQESMFWRKSLWERAGGRVDATLAYAVDAELWSRFFLLEPLWNVDAILGGFRVTGENRSLRKAEELGREVRQIRLTSWDAAPRCARGDARVLRVLHLLPLPAVFRDLLLLFLSPKRSARCSERCLRFDLHTRSLQKTMRGPLSRRRIVDALRFLPAAWSRAAGVSTVAGDRGR